MNTGKILKKAFFYSIAILSLILLVSSLVVYYYRDTIIQRFVAEANKYINTPIAVNEINVSIIDNFPEVSIIFNKIEIDGSNKKEKSKLLIADKLTIGFNPIKLWNNTYSIEGVSVENATCLISVDKQGIINYDIVKKQGSGESKNVDFDLKKVKLLNVHFIYDNQAIDNLVDLTTSNTSASLIYNNALFDIDASGSYQVHNISSRGNAFITEKEMQVNAKIIYDDINKKVGISPSSLQVSGSEFLTYGEYVFKDQQAIEIHLEGKDTNLNTISSFIPEPIQKKLSVYKSAGNTYFNLSLVGDLGEKIGPQLEVQFGLKEASIFYPDTDTRLKNANAEGYLKLADIYNTKQGMLELKNIEGNLDGSEFNSNLTIINFSNPKLIFDFSGAMDMKSLLNFYQPKGLNSASGSLDIDISFNGNVNDLKSRNLQGRTKTSGQIVCKGINLSIESLKYPLQNLNGQFLFNNIDIALNDVSGYYGKSDFRLNGLFKNLLAFILLENEPIGIEADLHSKYLDLDELLAQTNSKGSDKYYFELSPRLKLKFNTNIDRLTFRRFHPSNVKGNVIIKNQGLHSNGISFDAMGGNVSLTGNIEAPSNKSVDVKSQISISGLQIDSIFYVLENFNQGFIIDKNLKGVVNAEIETSMTFDHYLNLEPASLEASILTSISKGELNNFEPMKKLSKYVDEDKLDHLTFSNISNEIFIQDQTIYIPQMEVGTNITSLKISGTHQFNQEINYHVVTPLRSSKRIDKDEAFGAIEEDVSGQSMLYLKITGTTSDYQVSYDKQEVKKKIAADIKKELQELKDAFKNKGIKKEKAVELEEDEYFDWDDH